MGGEDRRGDGGVGVEERVERVRQRESELEGRRERGDWWKREGEIQHEGEESGRRG